MEINVSVSSLCNESVLAHHGRRVSTGEDQSDIIHQSFIVNLSVLGDFRKADNNEKEHASSPINCTDESEGPLGLEG